jgi:hypothetical protein
MRLYYRKGITEPLSETAEIPSSSLNSCLPFADRYRIIEELGQGGMGSVKKAVGVRSLIFDNDASVADQYAL